MFWADKIANDLEGQLKGKIASDGGIVIRDEKTASGRMLISAMRGAAVHGIISELFTERGIAHEFLWEINDTDAFRSVPKNLDEDTYKKYLGFPLHKLPSPGGSAKNYPEYFANEFKEVMDHLEFAPVYYRSSDAYKEGKFNDTIKIALGNAKAIRKIYKDVSGSEKPSDWLPIMMICEKCGKIATTKAVSFDGEKVLYECNSDTVEWADGCGHHGESSPFDGGATLPWKVEWAAKFKVFNVAIEGEGKDLSTKGGARDVSNHIAREIFHHEPPLDIQYEFFLSDGKKMSTSKGNAPAAREVVEVLPPLIYRLVFLGKKYNQAIEFNIKGDTIPKLFDRYDQIANFAWEKVETDDVRLFELVHTGETPERYFLPRFSQVAFLSQMPHVDMYEEFAKAKGSALTDGERKEIDERAEYAKKWLEQYAADEYKFELQSDSLPEEVKNFTSAQKKALEKLLKYVESQESVSGEDMHHKIHEIKSELGIEPKEFFSAIYLSFLGRTSGPQAGWFLSVLDKEFLVKRLTETVK